MGTTHKLQQTLVDYLNKPASVGYQNRTRQLVKV